MTKRKAEAVKTDVGEKAQAEAPSSGECSTPYPDYKRPHPEECMVSMLQPGMHAVHGSLTLILTLRDCNIRILQAACKALADLHGPPDNPFRQQEMDSKDMQAVQSALSEVTSTQRTVLDSTVRRMAHCSCTQQNLLVIGTPSTDNQHGQQSTSPPTSPAVTLPHCMV